MALSTVLKSVYQQGFIRLSLPSMGQLASRTVTRDLTSEAKFVETKIKENCVIIFSKTTCPSCKQAKMIFEDMNAKYEVVELDQRKDGKIIQDILLNLTGKNTVPRVFINGKCIGGGFETKELYKEGKLHALIEECAKS